MAKIKFLVDTGSDIPQHYLDKYDVSIVPLTLFIDGVGSRDYYDLNAIDYINHLRTCKQVPTSSQPSPALFFEYFEEYAPDYDHIICFTMAPAGSGTYNSACLGKEMYDEKHDGASCAVHVVDSKSCSLVEVLELEIAGDMAAKGADINSILAKLDDIRNRVATYYLVDNVDFLIKGGRVSVVKGTVASKLNLKPIVAIRGGEGSVLGSAMGYAKGLDKLLGYYNAEAEEGHKLFISHSDCADKAEMLVKKIKSAHPNVECMVTNMFCTMATQTGPDTVAMFYVKKK